MRDLSCRTKHSGPSAVALWDAVSLGPTWETRRHFGSLNGHGPSRHPGTPRRHCNRCRVSCKIQERRSSDVRATNTATLRHAEASTSRHCRDLHEEISAVSPVRAPSLPCGSNGPPFRCITEPVSQHNPYSDCDADTPRNSRSDCARIAVHHGCSASVVLLACCCRVAAFSKPAARRTVTAPVSREIAAAARSHTAPRLPRTPQRMARRTPRRPRAARSTPCTSSLATPPQPPHRPQPQPERRSPPRRRIPPGTVQRSAREHVERPRNSRAHRARTRHRLVGH